MRQPALTTTAAFQALEAHAVEAKDWDMRSLFAADPQRFPSLTVDAAGLFLDYSKNRLTLPRWRCW
jgi:glucose-6-phosphate isomerase